MKKLHKGLTPVSRHLYQQLSIKAQSMITQNYQKGTITFELRDILLSEINKQLTRESFYTPGLFYKTNLSAMTRKILEKEFYEIDVIERNHLLLADAFPNIIKSDSEDVSTFATKTNTFTINNNGDFTLSFGSNPITISGANANDFVVNKQPSNALGPGNSTNFEITFNPSVEGLRTATVNITSNDPNNPFTFTVQGQGRVKVSKDIFVATFGGLSISTDGGSTFINKTTADGLGRNDCQDVFVVGSNVFVATFGGLSISTDGGSTFINKTTADGLGRNDCRGVFVVGNNVFVATFGGLGISTDGGNTFVNKTTADGLAGSICQEVVVEGGVLFIATTSGLSISTDNGNTFVNKTAADGLGSNFCQSVFANGNNVYVTANVGLSISTDNGNTFVHKTSADGLADNICRDVFANGNNVFVATDSGVSISTDTGNTFVNKTTADGLGSKICEDVVANSIEVFVITNKGLGISIDGGVSFVNRTTTDGLGVDSGAGIFLK